MSVLFDCFSRRGWKIGASLNTILDYFAQYPGPYAFSSSRCPGGYMQVTVGIRKQLTGYSIAFIMPVNSIFVYHEQPC